MNKINETTIEQLKVNDKKLITCIYVPAKKATWFRKATPDKWGVVFLEKRTKEEIEKEGLLLIINNKIYTKPNFTISLASGKKLVYRVDTYKQAEQFAYEYIKKNNLLGFINIY